MPTRGGVPGLRRTSINVMAVWLLQGGTLLFSIVTVPLISRRFGLEGLGVWLLVQQVATHFQLLELGLASSLGRFLSRDATKKDYAAYTRHSSSATALLATMGMVLMFFALPAGFVFPEIFDIPLDLQWDAKAMMVIALMATGMLLPLRSAIGVLASQHRFDLQALVDGAALLLRIALVLTVCLFVREHALVALAVAIFLPGLIAGVAMYVVAHRSAPAALLDRSMVGRAAIMDLLGISLSAMVITFAAVLLRQGSAMVVGYSQGLGLVPLIALPTMLVVGLGPFLGVASQLISPVASQLDAAGNKSAALEIYLMASRYVASIGLFILFAIVFAGPILLPIWIGRDVLGPGQFDVFQTNLLVIFSGYCAALPAFVGRAVLVSVGKHNAAAQGELAAAIFGVAIGWVAMEFLGLGAVGMACGVALAYMLRGWGWLMYQLATYFGISAFRLQCKVWRMPVLASLPLMLSASLIQGREMSVGLLIPLGLVAALIWACVFWRLIVPDGHRAKVKLVIQRIL